VGAHPGERRGCDLGVLRARREAAAPALGRLVESAAGGRAGSIVGVVKPTAGKAAGRARRYCWRPTRTLRVVSFARHKSTMPCAARRVCASPPAPAGARRRIAACASAPNAGQAAAFWHPVRAWRDARHDPVEVDRTTIPRAENRRNRDCPGRDAGDAVVRGAGEAWKAMKVGLDRGGQRRARLLRDQLRLFLRASTAGAAVPKSKSRSRFPPSSQIWDHRALSFISQPGRRAAARRSDVIPLPAGTSVVTTGPRACRWPVRRGRSQRASSRCVSRAGASKDGSRRLLPVPGGCTRSRPTARPSRATRPSCIS